MNMDWRHLLFLAVILVAGYWLGVKFPGYLSKFTGGLVSG